jgi:hypothetical protein
MRMILWFCNHVGSGLAIQQFKGGQLQIVVMQDLTPFTI